jgi:methionyl aminopeptidase
MFPRRSQNQVEENLVDDTRTRLTKDGIRLYEAADFAGMHAAGRLAADILDRAAPLVYPGQTTAEIDRAVQSMVEEAGATSATIGYKGYQHATCISVNHVVCHGIPGDKTLKSGDALNIDITVIKDGFHGDTSRMFMVGKENILARRLATVAHEAMWLGIRELGPGKHLGNVGAAIQEYVERHRYSVVREYCGHGIGEVFHEDPQVLHYGRRGTGMELREGMTLTVEPMINAGKAPVRLLPDGWTVVTRDRSLSAQWEHTCLVTADGYEVLTLGANERK